MDLALYVLGWGALLSAALSALIVVSLRVEPRIWLHDAPRAIQDAVPPKSEREKRLTWMFAVPVFALALGIPVIAVAMRPVPLGYLEALAITYGVLSVFNVVDLVLIDWLLVCTWTPRWLVVPGTEHLLHVYRDHGFHLRECGKGCIGLFVLSLPLAALGLWLS